MVVNYFIDNYCYVHYALAAKEETMAEERTSGNMKKMAGIAAISAAAGAVAAVMLTPKSGRELRSSAKGKAQELRGKAKDKLEEAQ